LVRRRTVRVARCTVPDAIRRAREDVVGVKRPEMVVSSCFSATWGFSASRPERLAWVLRQSAGKSIAPDKAVVTTAVHDPQVLLHS